MVDDIQVYARVKPEQKMRIVETLKQKGEIVSMTGDGVNDAPALKNASIGVAMGSGTDVAKESGDMIIQDDNFETIVTAIREGRKIYDNIKRFVKFQVSTNVGAILTIVGTSIFMLPVPFNPVQLLWINIVMDGPPAQTLGMEGSERNIMTRQPETGDILNKKVLIKIFIAGLVMAIGSIALFSYKLAIGCKSKAGNDCSIYLICNVPVIQCIQFKIKFRQKKHLPLFGHYSMFHIAGIDCIYT